MALTAIAIEAKRFQLWLERSPQRLKGVSKGLLPHFQAPCSKRSSIGQRPVRGFLSGKENVT